MSKRRRIVLTAREIEALLAISGAADAPAVAEDFETEAEGDALLEAFESATTKLQQMLERKGK